MDNIDTFIESIDFYFNEFNFIVFTEKYHLQRGFCCGNGCRHCPFLFEKVTEPLRTQLIERKNNDWKEK
jgi:hypothetical protein